MNFEQLMAQYFPNVRKQYIGGSDGDPGEERWLDSMGQGRESGATGLDTWNGVFDQMANAQANGQAGINIDPARRMQILESMAQASPTATVNWEQMGQFLTPQENQALNQWVSYVDQENNKTRTGDLMAKAFFTIATAALGGAAMGAGGAAGGEAAAGGSWSGAAGLDGAMADSMANYSSMMGGSGAGFGAGADAAWGANQNGWTNGFDLPMGDTGGSWNSEIGLDGAMGDSAANYNAAMGATNPLTGPKIPDSSWGVNSLSKLLSGNAGASDYLKLGGNLLGSGLGAYGANQQAQAYGDIANKFMDMGAPYRGLLAQSYQPGFSMANQPDFMNALDVGSQAAARATSSKVGNPVDNPGAYADMQKYISGSLALPQLNTYRSQLGTFGQLGTSQAGQAMGNQVQAKGGMYDALGYGVGQVTQPENPLKGLLDQFKGFNINPARSY